MSESDYVEKLDTSINAIEQLVQLRLLCHYLINNGYAKKTGNKQIKPIPLFNKNAATYLPVDSIDAVTGNKFLKGQPLTTVSATKLMNWLHTHFSWAFVINTVTASYWTKLLNNSACHGEFMHFSLVSDEGNKLIDREALRQSVYHSLETISIHQQWYLTLQGQANDHFMVVLQSPDKTTQIAPLMPLESECFVSVMPKHETTLRYPSRVNLSFDQKDGLGWRRCIVIKAPFLPIQTKTVDNDLTLSAEEMDAFAIQLMCDNNTTLSIDLYEFILVDHVGK